MSINKNRYVGKKIGFYYDSKKGVHEVEAIIKDVSFLGILVRITKSNNVFYTVSNQYLIPLNASFVYKFL